MTGDYIQPPYPVYIPPQRPCPCCGHCPVCGHKPYEPVYPYQKPYTTPFIFTDAAGEGEQVTTVTYNAS